ncbi:MAG: hypothetical protein LBL34_02355 [Clostridiales bacterium]|jgi:hypothetical protein|nr:hypothetical protein [Clostridiales bacterium]
MNDNKLKLCERESDGLIIKSFCSNENRQDIDQTIITNIKKILQEDENFSDAE